MQYFSNLTVKEVLKFPGFSNARLLAGSDGVTRNVEWLHVMEIFEIGSLVHGGELILTTGIGLQKKLSLQLYYLQQLIDKEVAGLCIELGAYFPRVPQKMLEYAESADFPIIVFPNTVKFVDITREVNGYLINQRYRLVSDIEAISSELQQLSLKTSSIEDILQLVYEQTNNPIAYSPSHKTNKIYLPPNIKKTHRRKIMNIDFTTQNDTNHESNFEMETGTEESLIKEDIYALGHDWGQVVMLASDSKDDVDRLILEKTSTAVAQTLLRELYTREQKFHTETGWLEELLFGSTQETEENIRIKLRHQWPGVNINAGVVAVFQFVPPKKGQSATEDENGLVSQPVFKLKFSMVVRSIFSQYKLPVLLTIKGEELVALILLEKNEMPLPQLEKALEHIEKSASGDMFNQVSISMAVGAMYNDFTEIQQSYYEAIKVLYLQSNLPERIEPYYTKLGVYQLLLNLKNNRILDDYIETYLGSLKRYDEQKGTDLVNTLQVFLESGMEKTRTSKKLFITRQALYHRLEKIEYFLGNIWEESFYRLSVEIALKALQLKEATHVDRVRELK